MEQNKIPLYDDVVQKEVCVTQVTYKSSKINNHCLRYDDIFLIDIDNEPTPYQEVF